jgi:hypothetical protein
MCRIPLARKFVSTPATRTGLRRADLAWRRRLSTQFSLVGRCRPLVEVILDKHHERRYGTLLKIITNKVAAARR